jgi:putative ABC transport system permease protein
MFSLSLAFTLIGLNVYLATQVLNGTDITCDASVTLGGCSYGALVVLGINPVAAVFIAMCLGATAGFMTSSFITHIGIEPVLSSIITVAALQTFILKLSTANSIVTKEKAVSFLTSVPAVDNVLIVIPIVFICAALVYRMLNSEYGLAMRVYGDGKIISESLGINTSRVLWIGLGIANGLAAIAGALIAQVSGKFGPGTGSGSLVFGMASVIIGQKIVSPKSFKGAVIACFVGAFMYKAVMEVATFSGLDAKLGSEYHNVITATVLVLLIALIREEKKRKAI